MKRCSVHFDPPPLPVFGLDLELCRTRQTRLRKTLGLFDVDGAVIADPAHVFYFTGYRCREIFAPVFTVLRNGPATLFAPIPPDDDVTADRVELFESHKLGTLHDGQYEVAWRTAERSLPRGKSIGTDSPVPAACIATRPWHDITSGLWEMRKHKDVDEVALIQRALQAAEAAYAHAARILRAGVDEFDLFRKMRAIAVAHCGEDIGEFGNDFQIGSMGGPPRHREARSGEVAVLDLSVVLRKYRSDMCRSFSVGPPTDVQLQAREKILEVLQLVENQARPGVSCRDIDRMARDQLDGFNGWTFPHHLGHGIGLGQHESPRLNPHWDDHFEVGHVYTVEPGLYHPDLKAGLRIEQVYHMTEAGPVRLTQFPTELQIEP